MDKIKIGMLGIGHSHSTGKMTCLRRLPDMFDIIGVSSDFSESKAKVAHGAFEGLPFMSAQELLSKSDAVIVECDVKDLTTAGRLRKDAGKDNHIDKPGGNDTAEVAAIMKEAERKNLVVQMGYMYRNNPAIVKCLEMIKDGAVGEIFSIHAEMSARQDEKYRAWLGESAGGSMYIFGCHMIDLIQYLLGVPEKVISVLKSTGFDGINAQDNTLAVLEYEKALASISVSSAEVNGWGRRQFVVCGNKGTIEIKPLERTATMSYAKYSPENSIFEDIKEFIPVGDIAKGYRYDDMLKEFYYFVKGIKKNPFTYEHDIAVHKTVMEVSGI